MAIPDSTNANSAADRGRAVVAWLSRPRSAVFWRALLTGLFAYWWLRFATYVLTGQGWHPRWWTHFDDLASIAHAPWHVAATLAVALVAALVGPWALPASGIAPPGGWRTWLAIGVFVVLVPLHMASVDLFGRPVLEADATVAGRPTRPFLWIIAEFADAGLHLPRVDARRHDYYGVLYTASVPPGQAGGVWAQICGDVLDARWTGAQHRCLVDDRWRVVHGHRDSPRLDGLLASTGAEVTGGDQFGSADEDGSGTVADAALLRRALVPDKLRHHVLVLAGVAHPPFDPRQVAASDAAMDASIGEWLDRGGVALVTASRPRPHHGWKVLPARLYGVRDLVLPTDRDVAVQLGKAGPGRLMGGLPNASPYDAGCTAWELAGFGCSRLGYGTAVTREFSKTTGVFRPAR